MHNHHVPRDLKKQDAHNFAKCWLIFKNLSPADSAVNVMKWSLKILPHLKHVATVPCETPVTHWIWSSPGATHQSRLCVSVTWSPHTPSSVLICMWWGSILTHSGSCTGYGAVCRVMPSRRTSRHQRCAAIWWCLRIICWQSGWDVWQPADTATGSALPGREGPSQGQAVDTVNADCRCAQAAERRFRRTLAEVDRVAWNNALKLMHLLYEKKNSNYWRDKTAVSKGNTMRLWRTFRGVLGEAPRPHSAEDFASFFRDKVDGVRASSSSTSTYDVPLKSHTDIGRMDACVSQWGWKTEWHSHEQNVRPWSSPYVAGEGNAGTFIPIHNDIVQQVADHRLFSCGIQAGSCPAAVTEAWTWCQRPEEFSTCVQPAIPLQIVGKSHTVVYTGSRRSLTSTGWCWWHSLLAGSITAWRWPQPKSSMTCCLLQTGGRWRHSACST